MPALIQIVLRLITQAVIFLLALSLNYLGNINSEYFATTTPPKTEQIIVATTSQKSVLIPSTKPNSPKQKTPVATSTQTKNLPEENTSPVQQPVQKNIPSPSLNNLPVPVINLPTVSDATRAIDFGIFSSAYSTARESVVNILCLSTKGNLVSITTGSGVVIDPQGIVLTNAHVAETMLTPNQDCTLRQGDIATDKYKTSLVYVNEAWLSKNAGEIFSGAARGTGENDFALLAITSKINSSNADSVAYSVPMTREFSSHDKGTSLLATGYPGGTLGALSLKKFLMYVADVTKIEDVFTFHNNAVDVIETGVTKVGQRGSSGGGMFNNTGELVALIVSTDGTADENKINAITLPYISRAFREDTGMSLQDFMKINKNTLLSLFQENKITLMKYVNPYLK